MKPLILITNDDGIYSPGLKATVEAVYELGDLLIVAPHMQQTGMGRAFPRTEDQGIIEEIMLTLDNVQGREIKGYAVHGSPGYAVAHGVLELANRKPDICISGINYGENLGLVLTCSGTLGATFEANSHDIPSIAVSLEVDLSKQRLENHAELEWSSAKEITKFWVEKLLAGELPREVSIWNINIPAEELQVETYKITTQGRQNYFHFIKPDKRDFNKRFELKSERVVDLEILDKDSDIYTVYVERKTSVTPLTWDMSVRI